MANAYRDQNNVPTLIAVSNADGFTPVRVYADPTTHRLLVDLSSSSGTVTSVSVVSSNGFAGTVATATTTPAITLTTTITGILKGNGTAISAATVGTDYVTASSTNTFTNKTYDTAGTGNSFSINGTAITAVTGTGAVVLASSPTLTTASLGSSTATTQTPSDNSTKVATTAYVDAAVLGQNFKEAVKYASIAVLPSIIYANGSSGVGATLTGVALGAISLDSSSPSVNDRVLIKNQASSFQNGIYTVTATGSGAAVFILTRTSDANQSFEFKTGDSVFVTAGTTLASTTWAYTGVDSPTIGTDAITFVQTAGQGSFTAGNGIAITGVSIAIDTSVTVDKTTAQTLTNKTLTSPKIGTSILDTNGNTEVSIIATGSAVNYIELTNAATGTAGPIIAAQGETNTDLKIAAKGTGKVHHTTGTYGDITAYSPAGAGTATLTLNTSNIHTITMPAGNITIAISNSGVGQCFIINIIQDSGGSRTVTWFTTIKWAGGAPTLTTTANKIDTFGFIVTSAGNYQGYVVGQNM